MPCSAPDRRTPPIRLVHGPHHGPALVPKENPLSLNHRALVRRRRASALALTAIGSLLVVAAPSLAGAGRGSCLLYTSDAADE